MKIAVCTDMHMDADREKCYKVDDLETIIENIAEIDHNSEVKTEYHIVRRNVDERCVEGVDPETKEILWRDRSGMGWSPNGVKAILVAENETAWDRLTHDIDMMTR